MIQEPPRPPTAEQWAEAPARVRRILQELLREVKLFAALALRMKMVPAGEPQDIMADGDAMYFNPRWVMTKPASEIKEALAHVVLACALTHHTRRGDRSYQKWQMASHLATNPILKAAGLTRRREGVDKSIEWIYDHLPDPPEEPKGGAGGGSGDGNAPPPPGEVGDAPKPQAGPGDAPEGDSGGDGGGDTPQGEKPQDQRPNETQRQEMEQDWKRALTQANQLDKASGKREGDFGVLMDETIQAQATRLMSWHNLLRRFMRSYSNRDYTWMKPNRRYIASGLYLPSRQSEGMGHMVVGGDVSSSVDDDQLGMFWSVFLEMVNEIGPETVRVLQCNTGIVSDQTYDPWSLPSKLRVHGRGGTKYRPVFDAVANGKEPDVLLYFTDLFCNDYGKRPPYPVVWVVQNNGADMVPKMPPWGEVIWMPEAKEKAA